MVVLENKQKAGVVFFTWHIWANKVQVGAQMGEGKFC